MSERRSFDNEETSLVHGSINPAEVREGDNISARVISLDPNVPFDQTLRVWKLSPLGIELLLNNTDVDFKGLAVDLELQVGLQKSPLSGLVVDDVVETKGRRVLHIRMIPAGKERVESIERRSSNRWLCSDDFYPTAVASNPAFFNDFIYFKIRDISLGGLKLHTSLRNKFIVPGMVFDCIVNFPMVSQLKMKLRVMNVRMETNLGKEVLSVGVAYDSGDTFIAQSVGQYLMQFGSVTSLETLREQGFVVDSVADAVQFSYVRTKEEYDQVLELRFQAYKAAGKIKPGASAKDMADAYDSRSRIVLGKYKGEVVSSARLIFSRFEDSMEQEKYVKWPSHLPRRDEMVEIMRLCTRPDFRKSDLLMAMFKFMAVAVAQSKREWVALCATDDMIPLYDRIGFHQVGLSYEHTGLNNLRHHIMIGNVPDAMEGKTVGPVSWNIVWSDVSSYLDQYNVIKFDPMANIRLAIYRLLKPVASILYRMQRRAPKRQTVQNPAQVIAIGLEPLASADIGQLARKE